MTRHTKAGGKSIPFAAVHRSDLITSKGNMVFAHVELAYSTQNCYRRLFEPNSISLVVGLILVDIFLVRLSRKYLEVF